MERLLAWYRVGSSVGALVALLVANAIPLLGVARLPGAPPINHGLYYLLGLLALTSLTHMVFFGDDRYHLAISPVFCILPHHRKTVLRPALHVRPFAGRSGYYGLC